MFSPHAEQRYRRAWKRSNSSRSITDQYMPRAGAGNEGRVGCAGYTRRPPLGSGQVVRQLILDQPIGGSNPPSPATPRGPALTPDFISCRGISSSAEVLGGHIDSPA